MKTYKINIYSFFFILLWSMLLFSCREDQAPDTSQKEALQIYLQANNNKDQTILKSPIAILQGKFISDTSDLFFAVATREVATDTRLMIATETDSTIIGRYKKEYGKKLPLLPKEAYSLPESITIPAGKSISGNMLALTWKDPSVLKDKNTTYLLPVSIKDTDNKNVTLTSNRNTIFVEVKFSEITYSFKTVAGKTSDNIILNRALNGNTQVKGGNPNLSVSLNAPINIDSKVNVNIDNSLITTYNTANGKQLKVLPENMYTLNKTSLSIPKGKTVSDILEIQFTDAASQLNIQSQYLLPIKTVSQNAIPTSNDVVYLIISIEENNINSGVAVSGNTIDRNNWSVETNSNYNPGENGASKMLDGNNNTGWLSSYNGSSAQVTLDMKSPHTLKGFSITPTYLYDGYYTFFPKNITIYTSTNGTHWIKQGTYSNQTAGGSPQNPYIGWISFINPVNAQYVRFDFTITDEIFGMVGIGELNTIE
ncbi:exo-alpha-sialidase [Elizabethkingia miricola]|uniref:DUF1735 domain-containing protein n=1 Tax=Elizabethkingia miricola TaxID=172045 RepID=A0ABD5BBY5_ELIMR|nr:DUF1735 domain-containing protein [Elizabethkingia miricola]MDQ8751064.1 DUF1735 domain-containing protein [Elizabethkingia miricola]OPB84455.1 exo-alpha-sialidase [Elizabethkingia miricola]